MAEGLLSWGCPVPGSMDRWLCSCQGCPVSVSCCWVTRCEPISWRDSSAL